MIIITATHPQQSPSNARFEESLIRIGREVSNDLVLPSESCSRFHAEITYADGIYTLIDLGSTNGLEYDGVKVRQLILDNGCRIKVGEYTLDFSIPGEESLETKRMPALDQQAVPRPPEVEMNAPVLFLVYQVAGRQQSLKIAPGVDYSIGRSPAADLQLDDPKCSSRHAVITTRGREIFLVDRNSANGTYLNKKQIHEAPITAGDRIKIGDSSIAIERTATESIDDEILLAKTARYRITDIHTPAAPRASSLGKLTPGTRLALIAAILVISVVVVIGTWNTLERRNLRDRGGMDVRPAATNPEAISVQVARADRRELSFSVTGAGSVVPHREVVLSSEIAARVLELAASDGSSVNKGDLLIRLDDTEIRLQIQEASSSISSEQVDLARRDFERKQRLLEKEAVTRSALDQARDRLLTVEAAYKASKARVAQLRERASKTRILAPFDGTVARTMVNQGELAAPGTPLVALEDIEEILVEVEVSDREMVKLRPLQAVEAVSDAFPGRIFQGVVEAVSSTANPVSRGFEVEARIANPDGSLRSGMITTIRILHDKRSCLVVPEEALLDDSGLRARVLVVEGGLARSQPLELGGRLDRQVEVLAGLAEGQDVVIYGHEQVMDGQAVTTYR